LSLLLAVALVWGGVGTQARGVSTSATSTYVVEVESGRCLYESNADEERPIASITKIMTALVALESATEEELDQPCTVSRYAASVGESSLYLEEGDQITLRSALYGAMVRSGNDCAIVVAEAIAGSEADFCQRMNDKAAELGMTHSHFASANGLVDEDNYSTAHDMALLGAYAIQNPLFAQICGTWYTTTPDGYSMKNHNKLLQLDDRCIGIKTGYTTLAGRTLVSCGEDPETGMRVVCVTLNDGDDFDDHMALYDWAFANYTPHLLCRAGQVLTTLRLADGTACALVPETDVTYPLAEGETLNCTLRALGNCPTEENPQTGAEAGEAVWHRSGEAVASVKLCYGEVTPS
jgi:D-alanyl-D-alanine carboxypeptidase